MEVERESESWRPRLGPRETEREGEKEREGERGREGEMRPSAGPGGQRRLREAAA